MKLLFLAFCQQVIAESLSEEEIAGLKEMFKMIDTDNSGYITFDELKAGLKRFGANLDESEIHNLMKAVSIVFDNLYPSGGSYKQTKIRTMIKPNDDIIFLIYLQADVDNNGTIEYGEFIAATLHLNKIYKEDRLFKAFSFFDKDGSGYITQDELQIACQQFGIEDAHLEEMIQEADQNNVNISAYSLKFRR